MAKTVVNPDARPNIRNWFGAVPHQSDSLVYWQDESNFARGWDMHLGNQTFKTFDDYIAALRAAWDLINSDPKLVDAFKLLMEAQGRIVDMEAGDRAAGEDL